MLSAVSQPGRPGPSSCSPVFIEQELLHLTQGEHLVSLSRLSPLLFRPVSIPPLLYLVNPILPTVRGVNLPPVWSPSLL